MREFRILVSFGLLSVCLVAAPAVAQEDVTPPVLLEFTMSPTVFDTGQGNVTFDICTVAEDDLSGLRGVTVGYWFPDGRYERILNDYLGDRCTIAGPLRQFSPYGTYEIRVTLRDWVGNEISYVVGGDPTLGTRDLCVVGTCTLLNRPEIDLPDSDEDGIPDDSDNCPDDPNPEQVDSDYDLLGDICDPFPYDPDNEQAQCEMDLTDTLLALDQCLDLPKFNDADADGEEDSTDLCPFTPITDRVDADGCSLAQFCELFDASTPEGSQECRKADWLNDEPSSASPKDCLVDKSRADGTACVPRL